ncbi:MAG: hypothetical protein QXH03_10335 [Candidatus Bathyarchaeia archaeon]
MLTREQLQELIDLKLRYLLKAGEGGASQQYLSMSKMFDLAFFNFKLGLELSLLLDFNFIFNYGFDINLNYPFSYSFTDMLQDMAPELMMDIGIYGKSKYKYAKYTWYGQYGIAKYDIKRYISPERIPSDFLAPFHTLSSPQSSSQSSSSIDGRIPVRSGKHAWIHEAAYRLTYSYTSHYMRTFNNPLPHSQKLSESYGSYLARGASQPIPPAMFDLCCRLAEAFYMAGGLYDFSSYDMAYYYLEKAPIRFPKESPKEITDSDVPFYDLDRYDVATYDIYVRPDRIIWVDLRNMNMTRYDLALYDYARYGVGLRPPTDLIQQIIDYYKLMANPLWQGVLWVLSGERMVNNFTIERATQAHIERIVRAVVPKSQYALLPQYMAFAKELKYRRVTLGHATAEEVIEKYKDMGLDETLLKRIANRIFVGR